MVRKTDGYMTVKELGEYLSISPLTIYSWAASGRLPVTRMGRAVRFKKSHIGKWLEEQSCWPEFEYWR